MDKHLTDDVVLFMNRELGYVGLRIGIGVLAMLVSEEIITSINDSNFWKLYVRDCMMYVRCRYTYRYDAVLADPTYH